MNLRWSWHPQSLRPVPRRSTRPPGTPSARTRCACSARSAPSGSPRWPQDRDVPRPARRRARGPAGLPGDAALVPGAAAARPRSIAYFSPEFGITEVLPQYSGGLGILAGDHLKAASDLGVPILGVGLLYRAGYFKQSLNAEGWQQERYPPLDPHGLPLTLRHRGRRRARRRSASTCPRAASCTRTSGARRSAACRCCCSTPTSRRTPPRSARSPTASTAAAPTTACTRRCCSASAACGRCAPGRALTGDPEPEVFHTNEGHAGFLGVERIARARRSRACPSTRPRRPCAPAPSSPRTRPSPPASTASRADLIAPLLRRRPR